MKSNKKTQRKRKIWYTEKKNFSKVFFFFFYITFTLCFAFYFRLAQFSQCSHTSTTSPPFHRRASRKILSYLEFLCLLFDEKRKEKK